MTDVAVKYKIIGIWYSKPVILRDAHGEAHPGRNGVTICVGSVDMFGVGTKVVTSIEFDKELNAFRVNYKQGGLKIVPYLQDTEVTYNEIVNGKL